MLGAVEDHELTVEQDNERFTMLGAVEDHELTVEQDNERWVLNSFFGLYIVPDENLKW